MGEAKYQEWLKKHHQEKEKQKQSSTNQTSIQINISDFSLLSSVVPWSLWKQNNYDESLLPAPQHSIRYRQRKTIVPDISPVEVEMEEEAVFFRFLGILQKTICALLVLICILLWLNDHRMSTPCPERSWLFQLARCKYRNEEVWADSESQIGLFDDQLCRQDALVLDATGGNRSFYFDEDIYRWCVENAMWIAQHGGCSGEM